MLEHFLTHAIVIAAAGYLALRQWRARRRPASVRQEPGCPSGCGTCPLSRSCPSPRD